MAGTWCSTVTAIEETNVVAALSFVMEHHPAFCHHEKSSPRRGWLIANLRKATWPWRQPLLDTPSMLPNRRTTTLHSWERKACFSAFIPSLLPQMHCTGSHHAALIPNNQESVHSTRTNPYHVFLGSSWVIKYYPRWLMELGRFTELITAWIRIQWLGSKLDFEWKAAG